MWWDPIGYLTWLGHTYGDLAFVRVFTRRVYLLNGPAPIHDVLVAKEKHFRKFDRARHVLGTAFGNGLILSEGPDWLRQRRALYAAFHQPMMARYAHIMVARARQLIDEWRRQDRVELDHDMTRLALTIIGESLFSADLAPRSAHFARLAYELSTIYGAEEYNLFTLPDGFPLPSKRRKRAIVSEFHTLIRKLMAERRAASSHGDDLLTLLLDAIDRGEADGGMSEAQALDEAMTLFHGGYHSSSMGLAWLLFELTKHPQVVARVRAETDEVLAGRDATIADLPALRYTAMVVKEGLRLWPPAWEMFARENTADVELGGYRIAKGGIFLIHPFVTQRDPRFFPDPLRFDPQRFAAENDRAVSPFTYFPFGRGPHACIGATFASMEMTLVLATLVQHIQWRLAPGQPADVPPRPRMAIRPAAPIWIQPQARTDVAPAAADPIGASRS
jgi:cytochrome P450